MKKLNLMIKEWREKADNKDGWTSKESTWFSCLPEYDKNRWRVDQSYASGIRRCANELESFVIKEILS